MICEKMRTTCRTQAHLEIVLDNDEEICDNVISEKEITHIPIKNNVRLFLEQLVCRVVQGLL